MGSTNPREGENFQSYFSRIFKISSFQQKVARYTKKWGKYGPVTGKIKLPETVPEKAQTLDLIDKDFTSTLLNMLRELKENTKNLRKWGE